MTMDTEVLRCSAAEITRQEARVDVKANQLAMLSGTLATLAAGSAATIGALLPPAPEWWALITVPLVIAAGLWSAALVTLLRRIVRPHLQGPRRGSFIDPDHIKTLRGMSLDEYNEALVTRLSILVLRRYKAVALAVDLLIAGFVPLLIAALATVVVAVIS